MAKTTHLQTVEKKMKARITQLEPLVDEYRRLQSALRVLNNEEIRRTQVGGQALNISGGNIAKRVIEILQEEDSATADELASRIYGGKPATTYIYRVLYSLEADGKISREGERPIRWRLAGGA